MKNRKKSKPRLIQHAREETFPAQKCADENGVYRPGPAKRANPSLEQFRAFITEGERGTPLLKRFFDSSYGTPTWVHTYFPIVELEVHQIISFARAEKLSAEVGRSVPTSPIDLVLLRKRHPFVGAIAADAELENILKTPTGKNAKTFTAGIFSRLLNRQETTIKKWAQPGK